MDSLPTPNQEETQYAAISGPPMNSTLVAWSRNARLANSRTRTAERPGWKVKSNSSSVQHHREARTRNASVHGAVGFVGHLQFDQSRQVRDIGRLVFGGAFGLRFEAGGDGV